MVKAAEKLKVLGIAGTLSARGYNLYLLRAAQELAPEGMEIDIFDLSVVPLYNADLDDTPPGVKALNHAVRRSDALLIATPEYGHSIPGVLKNAIDWASWPSVESPLYGKPAAIMGVTAGLWGTVRAQDDLRKILAASRVRVVLRPEVLVARAKDKFDEEGRLTDEPTRKFVRMLLESLAEWTVRLRE